MQKTLKLGTRRSLLATAQSRLVACALEQANPDLAVELVGIDTRGDLTLDTPLSQMEGKDFFVTELDNALTGGQVDLTVHSLKDLSLERPAEITLAAIPVRANPRDVVLFAPDIIGRLQHGNPIRIGTSSPRRIENVPPFLERALPQYGATPLFDTREIRGNVNTRIGYLHRAEDDPQRIDAVVLAFAGLIRLQNDLEGQQELAGLLRDLRWMVLPLAECPAAPAQGALAIECRTDDEATLNLVAGLHCVETAAAVARERALLADWGGGCHQTLGATVENRQGLGDLTYTRGRRPDGTLVQAIDWMHDAAPLPAPHWDGTRWRSAAFETKPIVGLAPPDWAQQPGATFIAHSRALPTDWNDDFANGNQRIWTSGVRSWLRLAARGIWVEGCAEETGFDGLLPTLQQPVLGLPAAQDWHILTHSEGVTSWQDSMVAATYMVEPAGDIGADHAAVVALRSARSIFWASGSQYQMLSDWVPDDAQHACRHGKTYNQLQELLQYKNNRGLIAYPSVKHWRDHCK
jgi:hydroxymethylbilane synthase